MATSRQARRAARNDAGGGGKTRHLSSLDGIRAFAIIAVVLYHMSIPWLPSGHMGVVVFLVLTGYLASSSVLRSMRRGTFSLPGSWAKRVVRIWPAMAVMIFLVVAICAICNHVLLTKLKPDLLPSLLLSNNLAAILRGASYFDKLGGVSPLTHLWYLGVDFQFFVVWTAIAFFLCPNGRSTRVARRVALALALVSAILMVVLYNPNADPTRVYYGPDTRAFSPMLGAWLGLAWPLGGKPVRLDRARHNVRNVIPLQIAGPVALVGLVLIMVLVPDSSPFLYRGGMLLVSLLSVLVIAAALERRSLFCQLFSLPPLAWLGTRSYGLYLWHFPLFQLFGVTKNDTSPAMIALALVLSLLLAELSFRLVDGRITQGRLPLVVGEGPDPRAGGISYLTMLPAALVAIAIAGGATGLLVIPDQTAVPEDAIKSTGESAGEAMDLSKKDDQKQKTETGKDGSKDATKTDEAAKDTTAAQAKQDPNNLPTGSITLKASSDLTSKGMYSPVIVADSVAGDADWCFKEHAPDALLDSYIGRRPDQALSVLQGYLDQGVVGNIVVLDSFSNVPATDDTMKQLIEACGKRRVYLVNVRIPEVEQEQINKTIKKFADAYDNVTLIDWYAYSEGHDSWIYPDGEHLTPEGQPYYVDMITNAIAKDFVQEGGTVLAEGEKAATGTSAGTSTTTDSSTDTATGSGTGTTADSSTGASTSSTATGTGTDAGTGTSTSSTTTGTGTTTTS
ncbi:MAG: acyltransferase family protein [Coriobacteriales bacterium]|nr:acyltransferase family protein [Coriobacteriales bacterium]